MEARASVSGTLLTPDLVEYDIESWTPAAVVLRRDGPCSTEVFTIDLNAEVVSGAGYLINKDDTLCKVLNRNKSPGWTYQLSNGFKVYWEQRQKAHPLALRLFLALFPN